MFLWLNSIHEVDHSEKDFIDYGRKILGNGSPGKYIRDITLCGLHLMLPGGPGHNIPLLGGVTEEGRGKYDMVGPSW